MQRSLLFIVLLLLTIGSSCSPALKLREQKLQLDIAYDKLDSLNKQVVIKDIYNKVRKLDDNSKVRITKYTPPDSTGKQLVDYVVEVDRDISEETSSEIQKNEYQDLMEIHKDKSADNTIAGTQEEYDEPATVKGFRQLKGIIGLIFGIVLILLIVYVIYRYRG
jgi:hypothetical protein